MIEIITTDRKMLEIIQLAKTVAQSKATILIQGESGTGKELIASLVHDSSSRSAKPFVAINCAAIPENLLESELFGYERGSFTGAISSKAGKFELANGGTLLLDEISEMDLRLQAKLLRVIQECEVDRIGGRKPIAVDVRIIATTNRNLSDCVKKGSFREDLFYRLNVVNLTLPPLRERIGDVSKLSNAFMKKYSDINNKAITEFTQDALGLLEAYHWPGNIRELENVIERAVITTQNGAISAREIHISHSSHLSADSAALAEKNWTPGRTLEQIEKKIILEALEYHHGNRTHTAKALGISIRTLRNKIAEFRKEGLEV